MRLTIFLVCALWCQLVNGGQVSRECQFHLASDAATLTAQFDISTGWLEIVDRFEVCEVKGVPTIIAAYMKQETVFSNVVVARMLSLTDLQQPPGEDFSGRYFRIARKMGEHTGATDVFGREAVLIHLDEDLEQFGEFKTKQLLQVIDCSEDRDCIMQCFDSRGWLWKQLHGRSDKVEELLSQNDISVNYVDLVMSGENTISIDLSTDNASWLLVFSTESMLKLEDIFLSET